MLQPCKALKTSIGNPPNLGWTDPNPCKWEHVDCSDNRVTKIQIGSQSLKGTLPPDLRNLTSLTVLEVMKNELSGPIPSLAGLSSLQEVLFNDNNFTYFPPDFFSGLTSLQTISLDYNSFEVWEIPVSLTNATTLQKFSANGANVTGTVPGFLGGDVFPGLKSLNLAMNNLHGQLPESFAGSAIETLWLNGQNSDTKLNGSVSLLQNMTSLTQVWLHMNQFTGPLPDLSGLTGLKDFSLRDNQLTGIVPSSLVNLPGLSTVNLTNNLLQGPTPKFDTSKIRVDMRTGSNSFCLDDPGFPCASQIWKGISCDSGGSITVVNFQNLGLTGTISSNFSQLTSLRHLLLSGNSLTGTIPNELTTLSKLEKLDVSNNHIFGKVPKFRQNVIVNIHGNPDIGKDNSSFTPGTPPGGSSGTPGTHSGETSSSGSGSKNTGKIVGSVIGAVCGAFIVGLGVCLYTRKRKRSSRVQSPNTVVIHPQNAGDGNGVKITVTNSSVNGGGSDSHSLTSSGPSDIHVVEAGNMVISIQVLRNCTDDLAVTGRVTTKVDVFSFGVILMELISGRKALDETQPEDSVHLVTWFRRMHINKDTFRKAIDQTIELGEETLASVSTVAELAGHCCAREPYQRPDMGHVVNVISSLAELWKPAEPDSDDIYGIDLDMTLPQALKKWQAYEGSGNMDDSSSSFLASADNTQTSIPTRPSGFAESFTSADGR
ncbi:hypothetical protein Patl1_15624 [Pistacia atlantica]|uniref:Uncharacterized protein n=1 Tax=Pistacia atlantica TaxID=434234 RepID=A0ACC1BB28_9ROSI|nr:hypothetical protein Patl1_15624 [Pistacia atlantica]